MRLKLGSMLIHTGWARTGFWQLNKDRDVHTFILSLTKVERAEKYLYAFYLGPLYIKIGIL